jgi:MraZ protein
MQSEPDDITQMPVAAPKKTASSDKLVFYGNYDLAIDKQHRLLLPSDIRGLLEVNPEGGAFFIIVGINKKPWFYTHDRYFALAGELETDNTPEDDELAYIQMMFGQATKQPWDTQGRVPVPEKVRRKTGIGTVVTLVGAKDHLELWDRDEWAKHEEELDRMRVEVFRRRAKTKKHPAQLAQPSQPQTNSNEPMM